MQRPIARRRAERRGDFVELRSRPKADSLGFDFWRARNEQQVENQQHDPDVNGRVSEIEDEEVTPKGMQIEIVNHRSMRKAINRIAERAADYQSKADGGKHGSRSNQPPPEQPGRPQGQREQSRLPQLRTRERTY